MNCLNTTGKCVCSFSERNGGRGQTWGANLVRLKMHQFSHSGDWASLVRVQAVVGGFQEEVGFPQGGGVCPSRELGLPIP